jgi:hypothetical protein
MPVIDRGRSLPRRLIARANQDHASIRRERQLRPRFDVAEAAMRGLPTDAQRRTDLRTGRRAPQRAPRKVPLHRIQRSLKLSQRRQPLKRVAFHQGALQHSDDLFRIRDHICTTDQVFVSEARQVVDSSGGNAVRPAHAGADRYGPSTAPGRESHQRSSACSVRAALATASTSAELPTVLPTRMPEGQASVHGSPAGCSDAAA